MTPILSVRVCELFSGPFQSAKHDVGHRDVDHRFAGRGIPDSGLVGASLGSKPSGREGK
jgi:hypothetical protein